MQVTLQVEAPAHDTLLLAPTVSSHIDAPAQLTLHDSPHAPVQLFPLVQASEQLEPAHAELVRSQEVCAGQLHDVPLQVGGGGESLPHAPKIIRMKQSLTIDQNGNGSRRAPRRTNVARE
ncbi:MAG TPA: hypothetical protein VFQ65_12515 [Kofleriaceae bacterium]|nr:hypothetical protein [Kofleriaceae bacterium]